MVRGIVHPRVTLSMDTLAGLMVLLNRARAVMRAVGWERSWGRRARRAVAVVSVAKSHGRIDLRKKWSSVWEMLLGGWFWLYSLLLASLSSSLFPQPLLLVEDDGGRGGGGGGRAGEKMGRMRYVL